MSTDAGVQWFVGLGFRPAVWTASHRADGVDPQRLAVAPDADVAMIGKFDPFAHIPSEGYAWGTWIPAPVTDAPQITAASLAGPTPGPAVWYPSTPSQPWWPSEPNWPEYPCNCITPDSPDMPPVAPVPVPASAGLLLTAVVVLAWLRRRA